MSDNWKSPTTIIGLVTLLLSIGGNIFQYSNFEFEKHKWETNKEEVIAQKNDLEKRLAVYINQHKVWEQRILELKKEIENYTADIESLRKEINSSIFIAGIATSRSLDPESTEDEKNDAIQRSEAALERSKYLSKEKEQLVQEKKEKELEYNKLVALIN